MAHLIYSMLASLDGYVEDADGGFAWATPSEEVHAFANEIGASVGTNLYGRRMHETMLFWETAHEVPGIGAVELAWARSWRAAEKVVVSTTLAAGCVQGLEGHRRGLPPLRGGEASVSFLEDLVFESGAGALSPRA